MKSLSRSCLLALSTIAVTGQLCAEDPDLSRGAEILAPFKLQLRDALQAGLAQGPSQAIDACRVSAPDIATDLSQNGIRVGRTSDRLRNPANIAPDWVVEVLSQYTEQTGSRLPQTVALGNDRSGFVEPILVKPLCLTCHGENLSADISAQLAQHYPEDEAIGYAAGDLRGVFWTEFPAREATQ